MICTSCGRANLPGGVRCVYCGAPLPVPMEFHIDQESDATEPGPAKPAAKQGRGAGMVGALAVLALKAKSLLAVLKVAKLATTFGSMFVSVVAMAQIYGYKLALGLVVSIFVHEMGHVVVNWSKGLKQSAPMFIPFVGAVIFIKQFPDDPTIQSESGAGGPAAGLLAAVVSLIVAHYTGSPLWYTISYLGFVINLFNLIPFPPLDGSHIVTVFSPRLWDCVLIGLLLWAIKGGSGFLWMILIVGFIFRLGRADYTRHLLARPGVRLRMAFVYFGLCVSLSLGATYAQQFTRPNGLASRVTARRASREAGRNPFTTAVRPTDSAEQNRILRPGESLDSAGPDSAEVPIRLVSPGMEWGLLGISAVVAVMLLWLGTSFLLASAARREVTLVTIAPAVWATCGIAAMLYLLHVIQPGGYVGLGLIGAYLAASVSAVVFAGYQSHHLGSTGIRPPHFSLVLRCLAWASGAALIVAYGVDNLAVAATVTVGVVIFFARYRWALFGQLAAVTRQLSNLGAAIQWRERALGLHPDSDSAAALWLAQTQDYITLGRGADALACLGSVDAISGGAPGNAIPGPSEVPYLQIRCSALMLLDLFDEAVSCCEQILRAADRVPSRGNARLVLAHNLLAELARMRDWPDEMKAQADCAIRLTTSATRPQLSTMLGVKAVGMAEMGDVKGARRAAALAAKSIHDLIADSRQATVAAQIALVSGETDVAVSESERAFGQLPDSLESAYWRARALLESVRISEGRLAMASLAESYPGEHWGRLAAGQIQKLDGRAAAAFS